MRCSTIDRSSKVVKDHDNGDSDNDDGMDGQDGGGGGSSNGGRTSHSVNQAPVVKHTDSTSRTFQKSARGPVDGDQSTPAQPSDDVSLT